MRRYQVVLRVVPHVRGQQQLNPRPHCAERTAAETGIHWQQPLSEQQQSVCLRPNADITRERPVFSNPLCLSCVLRHFHGTLSIAWLIYANAYRVP